MSVLNMNVSLENIERIARDLVDVLTTIDDNRPYAVDTVSKLTAGELLVLNKIFDGKMDSIATNIVLTRRRLELDESGHIKGLVMQIDDYDVIDNMHLLPYLTDLYIAEPGRRNRQSVFSKLSTAPNLQTIYVYSVERRMPNIHGLNYEYSLEEYDYSDDTDIQYYRIEML